MVGQRLYLLMGMKMTLQDFAVTLHNITNLSQSCCKCLSWVCLKGYPGRQCGSHFANLTLWEMKISFGFRKGLEEVHLQIRTKMHAVKEQSLSFSFKIFPGIPSVIPYFLPYLPFLKCAYALQVQKVLQINLPWPVQILEGHHLAWHAECLTGSFNNWLIRDE